MGHGDPPVSPERFYQESGLPDGSITITCDVFFANTPQGDGTHLLASNPALRVIRAANCPWNTLVVGNGRRNVPIPVGTTNLSRAQMNSQGFFTREDVLGYEITLTNT